MSKQQTGYSSQFNFQPALEAAEGLKTHNELASEPGVHAYQIGAWMRQLLERGSRLMRLTCEDAILRLAADDGLCATAWLPGQPATGPTVDADHGLAGDYIE